MDPVGWESRNRAYRTDVSVFYFYPVGFAIILVSIFDDEDNRYDWKRNQTEVPRLFCCSRPPGSQKLATFAGQRTINPFPKPLAPAGYTVNDTKLAQPEITLQYLLFDSGKRRASVDAATAETLVAGANFMKVNQSVAFQVASGACPLG